jgi:hypothetical protein
LGCPPSHVGSLNEARADWGVISNEAAIAAIMQKQENVLRYFLDVRILKSPKIVGLILL